MREREIIRDEDIKFGRDGSRCGQKQSLTSVKR
jgi:hypothetical protein